MAKRGLTVRHMLADDKVMLLHLELARGRPWILGRRVKVASARGRDKFDRHLV